MYSRAAHLFDLVGVVGWVGGVGRGLLEPVRAFALPTRPSQALALLGVRGSSSRGGGVWVGARVVCVNNEVTQGEIGYGNCQI